MAYKVICGIYEIVCVPTGERYVGSAQSIKARWVTHRSHLKRGIHHSKLLQSRWLEHGPSAFKFSVLEIVERDKLLSVERAYVVSGAYAFNAIVPRRNPMQGRQHSPESRALMSANRKGKPGRPKGDVFSEEHRAAISIAKKGKPSRLKGRKLSAEFCQRMSEARRGKPSPLRGKKRSAETIQKMRDAALRADHSNTRRGENHPWFGKKPWSYGKPGKRGGDHPKAKAVIVEGQYYPSMTEAADGLGIKINTFFKKKREGRLTVILAPREAQLENA